MKKIAIFLALLFISAVPASALSAECAVLMDAHTGKVIIEKNPNLRRGIASTTKIMTAMIALENGNLKDDVTVTKKHTLVEGSSMYLREGESFTLEELLYGLMLKSGNDASLAVAEAVAGNEEAFVAMMNSKARLMGLFDTSFANPNGLDDENHYSTAYELALISSAAMKNSVFRKIVSTKSIRLKGECHEPRYLINGNKLLWYSDEVVGIKTGFTKKCGRTLVSAFEKYGRTFIAVTLNAPDDWNDHKYMYAEAVKSLKEIAVYFNEYLPASLPVAGGEKDDVMIVCPPESLIGIFPGERVSVSVQLPKFVYAPVESGQKVGTAKIMVEGKELASVDLIAGEDINPHMKKGFFQGIADKFRLFSLIYGRK